MQEDRAETGAGRAGLSFTIYRWAPLALLVALFLYRGFCLTVIPIVAPSLLDEWNIAARDLAGPLALIAIGAALGGVLGGFLGDAWGRRLTLLAFVVLQGATIFSIAFIQGLPALYALAFVNGVCLGGVLPIGMALMTELTVPARRGLIVSVAILAGPVGLGASSLAAGYITPRFGWEMLFLIGGGLAAGLFVILALFLPESPAYLAKFPGRAEERAKLLRRVGLTGKEDENPAEESKGEAKAKPGMLQSAARLLRENMGSTLGLWALFFIMYLLGAAIFSWLPVVFDSLALGETFASQSIFYWTIGSMIATPLSGWAIGRLGVYRVGLLFGAGMILSLGTVVAVLAGTPTGQIMMLLLPLAGFTVAGQVTSLYTLAAQTYPSAVRAAGIGLADAAGRLGGIASAYAGVYAFELGGAQGFFIGVLALAVSGCLVLAMLWLGNRRQERESAAAA